MRIKGGHRRTKSNNLLGMNHHLWLILIHYLVNDMQRIALARQALLVQKCKQTQLENPGVRVKCEVLLYA